MVVEAVADTPAPFFASVLDRLRPVGLVPVFAHPERSRAVQRDPALLAASRRDGALVQTVAPSLVGRWGRDVARTAWTLVERDLTDLVGRMPTASVPAARICWKRPRRWPSAWAASVPRS